MITMATLMKLLLINSVASSLFGDSRRFRTSLSVLSSFRTSSCNWLGPSEKKATSAPETIADPTRSNKIARIPAITTKVKPPTGTLSKINENMLKMSESKISKVNGIG